MYILCTYMYCFEYVLIISTEKVIGEVLRLTRNAPRNLCVPNRLLIRLVNDPNFGFCAFLLRIEYSNIFISFIIHT